MKVTKTVTIECDKCADIIYLPSRLISSTNQSISIYLFKNYWGIEDSKLKCPACNYCDEANKKEGKYKVIYNKFQAIIVKGKVDRLKTICRIDGIISFSSNNDAKNWIDNKYKDTKLTLESTLKLNSTSLS